MLKLSVYLNGEGLLHDFLVGSLIKGQLDYNQSFGVLTTGLYVPLAAVLPYVTAFYLIISFLEDSGYLPRLAVMVDTLMHKLGIHGLSIIPMLLGLGCNVPGAMATRVMETKRQRFIAITLLAIAVPCISLQSMIIALVGPYGSKGLLLVFSILALVWVVLGLLLNRFVKGESLEIFMEIPPYRVPYFRGMFKKLWVRIKWFLKEAIPFVMLGVVVANLLYLTGIIGVVGSALKPLVSGLLGLPQDAVGALLLGFLRKDIAVGMLVPLELNLKQLIIASVILSMYFPCVATFSVIIKELGFKDMLKAVLIMFSSSLLVGGLLNLVL